MYLLLVLLYIILLELKYIIYKGGWFMKPNMPTVENSKVTKEMWRKGISKKASEIMRLGKYNDFMYSYDVRQPTNESQLKRRDEIVRSYITDLYFSPIDVFNVDEDFLYAPNLFSMSIVECAKFGQVIHSYVYKTCIEITSKFRMNKLRWRVNAGDDSMYFSIAKKKDGSIFICVTYFSEENKTCVITIIDIVSEELSGVKSVSYYLSRRQNRIDNEFKNSKFIPYGYLDPIALSIVYESCLIFLKCGKPSVTSDDKYTGMEYSFLQCDLTSILFNKYNNGLLPVKVIQWGEVEGDTIIRTTINNTYPICLDSDNNHPIISLSEKEWDKVNRYIKKNYPDTCDILRVFEHPRYGATLIARYTDGESDILLKCSYNIDTNNKSIHLFLIYEENQRIISYMDFIVLNPEKFIGVENISMILFNIINKNNSNIISGWKEMKECRADIFKDYLTPFDIIYRYICLQIMLYDKPERVRCVREEKKSTSSVKHERKKTDYVVERVIMYADTAKEYVRKMSSEHADREYVLETWTRVGHYRRKPGSDEKIWIEPTTCKRRLPLVEKEILIKL